MEFLEFAKKNELFNRGDTIILAVSGGSDSLCMLANFLSVREEYDLELVIAHVNHMYREEAEGDADYVRRLSEKNGLKFYLEEKSMEGLAKEEGLSLEEAGRKIRYDFFYSIKESLEKAGRKNVLIATAHNKNDLVETFFFNLFRGTGLKGLTGIKAKTGPIIRPILYLEKKEIEEYVRESGMEVRLDKTNFQNDFTRNSIRNELIPFIEKSYQENIVENIYRTAGLLSDDYDLIEEGLDDYIDKEVVVSKEKMEVDRASFEKKSLAFKRSLVRRIIFILRGSLDGFSKAHIEEIIKVFESPSGRGMTLGGLSFRTSFNKLIIEKKVEKEDLREELFIDTKENSSLIFNGYKIEIGREVNSGKRERGAYYFSEGLDRIIIRTRRDGDRMVYRPSSSKKLKDIFIEEKVDREERDRAPIFTDEDGEIILLSNIRRSSLYFVEKEDRERLVLRVRKEE